MRKIFSLIIFVFSAVLLFSQPPCIPEDGQEPPTLNCADAPVICTIGFLDGYCLDMSEGNSGGSQPNPLCPGGGTVHNVSWFAFVAGANLIEMEFLAVNCTQMGGFVGMQVGVYDGCDFSNALFCQPNCFTGSQTFQSDQFIPGQTYYIFIDGCAGSVCNVTVSILQGNVPYVIPDPIGIDYTSPPLPPTFPEEICQGGTLDMEAFGGDPALDYIWTINPASTDYPDGIVNLTTYSGGVTFSDLGTFEICTQAITSCDSSIIVCTTIDVGTLEPEVFMPIEVCEEDFPTSGPGAEDPNGDGIVGWVGGQITDPGLNFGSYTNSAGCIIYQEIDVTQIDLQPRETVEVATCDNSYTYCGNTFTTDLINEWITCDGFAASGCDSLVSLYLTLISSQGILTADCGIFTNGLELTFNGFIQPLTANVSWEVWHNGASVVASGSGNPSNVPIMVDPALAGTYELVFTVEVIAFDGFTVLASCNYAYSVDVAAEDIYPPDPVDDNWPSTVCEGETITYSLAAGTDPEYVYTWFVPSGATITSNDNTSITVDWTGASSGDICVSAYNFCAFSGDFCFPIEVTPTPIASFSLPDTVCVVDSALIVYDGAALNNGDYAWNFGGGSVVNGTNGEGPGGHEVKWLTSGIKFVSLEVSENGCESTLFSDSIFVEAPVSTPLVSCTPSIDQVIFSWNPVPGATGYIVTVTTGQTGTLNGTEFTVTGLNPGDNVGITIVIESDFICPIDIIVADCTAEDCPGPMIEVTPVAEICLDANAGSEDLEALVTPNNGGTEMWDGPGIIDSLNGIFDPAEAGPGTHQIIFTYVEDCDFQEEIFIVVNQQPTADFTATDSICLDDLAEVTYQGDSPNGTFVWDFDGATNVVGSSEGPYDVEWDAGGLKTISCVVTTNDCDSEEFTYDVYVEAPLDSLALTCDPSTNDITFDWTAIPGVNDYEVFINDVLVGTQSTTTYNVPGLNPGDNIKITVVAISEGLCPSVTSTLSCEAQNCATVNISLVPDDNNICLDANTNDITIDAQINGGTGIDIVETWTGTAVTDQGVFDPASAGAGTHEIIYSYAEGNCDNLDTIYMVVYNTPTADFTVTDVICVTDTAQIDFSGTIVGVDTDFTFNLGGGGNISGTNPGPYQVWYNSPGTYDIKLFVEEDGCVSEEIVQTIVVEPELEAPVISCNESTSQIEFSWDAVDCASSYEVYIDGSFEGTQTSLTFIETGLVPLQQVSIEVIAISECLCSDVASTKVCFAKDCPDVTVDITQIGPFCEDDIADIVQLDANINGGAGTGSAVWSGAGVTQDGEWDGTVLGVGSHVVTYTYTEDDCNFPVETTIEIFGSPSASVVNSDVSCFGANDGTISVSGSGGDGNYTYDISGNINTTGEYSNLGPGNYTILVSDGNDCDFTLDATITEPLDGSIATQSSSTLIVPGESADLSLSTTNIPDNLIDSIVWTENGAVVCSGPGTECLDLQASPTEDALYCATIYYNGGCQTEDCIEVRIQLIKKVFIPNVFSPNNDGVNDRFIIFSDESVVNLTYLRIYNRWGELMYEVENVTPGDESKGWDGTFNGKVVNPGVYIFKTEFEHDDGELEDVYGDITVVK